MIVTVNVLVWVTLFRGSVRGIWKPEGRGHLGYRDRLLHDWFASGCHRIRPSPPHRHPKHCRFQRTGSNRRSVALFL